MSFPDPSAVSNYGFTAQPASTKILLSGNQAPSAPIPVSSIPIPSTATAFYIQEYAKAQLPRPTFHHSMRVFLLGASIARQHFPSWHLAQGSPLEETYFLACMLHDIGTTDTNLNSTLMSFEFYGARIALSELAKAKTPNAQAESVAEAIIRHQDIGECGEVTLITALIQLATILDNIGQHSELVHKETIEAVVKAWPREGWSTCFASVIRRENGRKPWANTTRLGEEDFPNGVLGNQVMNPYE